MDIDLEQAEFDASDPDLVGGWRKLGIESLGDVRRVEFFVLPQDKIRYEVASREGGRLRYRVERGGNDGTAGKLVEFLPLEEHVVSARAPWFQDVTAAVMKTAPECAEQFSRGVPYWRARLDPASGIDIYGSNGVAVGDIDNDGEDEIYICQPGGLPNRLLKFNADGRMRDLTAEWGVGLLDDTSCALFCDLRNCGRQDLVVLRGSGPVLYLNEGDRFRLRTDAFRFVTLPKGAFTGMAAADFDRDGKLDLYLCCYVYSKAKRNTRTPLPMTMRATGRPIFCFGTGWMRRAGEYLKRRRRNGDDGEQRPVQFRAGLGATTTGTVGPIFRGKRLRAKELYRNETGALPHMASKTQADDIGPGMSASWLMTTTTDCRTCTLQMWTAAGQRVMATRHSRGTQGPGGISFAHQWR